MQHVTRRPLTDDSGLEPEKCPNCGAPPEEIGVVEQFENAAVGVPLANVPGAAIGFDHRRRCFQCVRCRHEWKMDRVVDLSR
jgi:hypothetical protein